MKRTRLVAVPLAIVMAVGLIGSVALPQHAEAQSETLQADLDRQIIAILLEMIRLLQAQIELLIEQQGGEKDYLTICHDPDGVERTMRVHRSEWTGYHWGHGDHKGPCHDDGNEQGEIDDFDIEDAENDEVEPGDERVEIAQIEFDVEDSDVTLQRLDLVFESLTPAREDNPWLIFEEVGLALDGRVIAIVQTDDEDAWEEDNFDDDNDDEYRVRFDSSSGLAELDEGDHDIQVIATIEEDERRIDELPQTWELFVPKSGSQGALFVWPNGVTHVEGNSGDRASFEIVEDGNDGGGGNGGDAELEFSLSRDNPDSRTIVVEEDRDSSKEMVLALDMEAENGDVTINQLYFIVDIILGDNDEVRDAEDTFQDVVDDIWFSFNPEVDFEEGVTQSDEVDLDGDGNDDSRTLILFDLEDQNDEVEIDEGDAEGGEVRVRFEALDGNYPEGTEIRVSMFNSDYYRTALNENTVDATDAESEGDDLGSQQLKGSAVGDFHRLALEAHECHQDEDCAQDEYIEVEPVSHDSSETYNDNGETIRTEFDFTVEVEAYGDTFYVPIDVGSSRDSAQAGLVFSIEDPNTNNDKAGWNGEVDAAYISNASADQDGDFYRIDSGDSETLTVHVELTQATGFSGAHRLQLEKVNYYDDSTYLASSSVFYLRPEADYQTGSEVLDDTSGGIGGVAGGRDGRTTN